MGDRVIFNSKQKLLPKIIFGNFLTPLKDLNEILLDGVKKFKKIFLGATYFLRPNDTTLHHSKDLN